MKKGLILFIFVVIVLCLAWSQKQYIMNVYHKNGVIDKIPVNSLDSITFDERDLYPTEKTEIEITKIWDNGLYCAFPSLIKYHGKYYCAFREGTSHAGDNGYIRIISSDDGINWDSQETIIKQGSDLRDPFLSIKPEGQLFLLCGIRSEIEPGKFIVRTGIALYDENDGSFQEVKEVNLMISETHKYACEWLWRLTWYNGKGYGIAYYTDDEDCKVSLFVTDDGSYFRKITDFNVEGNLTEGRIQFTSNGEMVTMIRRDDENSKGLLGCSSFPYTDWRWENLDFYVAGHDFIIENNYMVCSTRGVNEGYHVNIHWGKINENFPWRYVIPSSGSWLGNTGYSSIINEDDSLWIAYYSQHDSEMPSIYLCKFSKRLIFH